MGYYPTTASSHWQAGQGRVVKGHVGIGGSGWALQWMAHLPLQLTGPLSQPKAPRCCAADEEEEEEGAIEGSGDGGAEATKKRRMTYPVFQARDKLCRSSAGIACIVACTTMLHRMHYTTGMTCQLLHL